MAIPVHCKIVGGGGGGRGEGPPSSPVPTPLMLYTSSHTIIILKLQLSMCMCVFMRAGGHWKPFEQDSNHFFLYNYKVKTGCYITEPTNTASKGSPPTLPVKALAQDYNIDLYLVARRLPKSMTWELRLSMCASWRDDSILSVIGGELLRMKL